MGSSPDSHFWVPGSVSPDTDDSAAIPWAPTAHRGPAWPAQAEAHFFVTTTAWAWGLEHLAASFSPENELTTNPISQLGKTETLRASTRAWGRGRLQLLPCDGACFGLSLDKCGQKLKAWTFNLSTSEPPLRSSKRGGLLACLEPIASLPPCFLLPPSSTSRQASGPVG